MPPLKNSERTDTRSNWVPAGHLVRDRRARGTHGLAVKAELDDYYEQEINHGRLYPNLDDLVEKGLLKKGELDKRTNLYSLTQRGSREIEARREWEDEYIESAEEVATST